MALMAIAGVLAIQHATAANVNITANITTSQTWTKNNDYILTQPIYVTSGATLTIEAGTVVRGEPTDLDPNSNPLNNPGTLIITRGSKLFALGTRTEPIVFTDLNDDHVRGNPGTDPYDTFDNASQLTGRWGGLILLGRGYVANNTGAAADPNREVQIEGLTAVGGLGLYGNGGNDNDDSGSINYVIIRYGGFNLAPNNEINGLTLGAVGRETDIDYVEVFQNKDDGIEMFGGTVNLKHAIVADGGDDGIDYDEGYRGKGQFILVLQGTPGSDKSDKAGEHDGGNNPDQSKPIATPAFYNVTYIGLGADKTTYTARSTNTALHLRDNAGGRFYNSAILDFGGAETLIEGATLPGDANTINTSGQRAQTAYVIDGTFNLGPASAFELEYEDNDLWCIGRQEDLGVPLTLPTGNSVTYGGDPNKNHLDNGFYTNSALDNTYLGCTSGTLPIRELLRTDSGDTATPDQVTSLDPRPKPGSPLLTTDRTPPADGFFTAAPYKGAFGLTENWAYGWTSLSQLGVLTAPISQVDVASNITTSQTWNAGTEYILKNPVYVTSGATLTIEAGTVVRGEPTDLDPNSNPLNNPGTLIITRGSKLVALGTPSKPIIFTDLNDDHVRGNPGTDPYDTFDNASQLTGRWGGLILLGRGYIANNTGVAADPNREVQIEGLTAVGGLGLYGNGGNDSDDSGSLRNIIIRYGGFNLAPNNEINGLTLGGVGRETDIDYVEVFQNKDDGMEMFGGTVNIKHAIVADGGDDGIDYDEGYRGKGQFILVLQGTPGSDKSDKAGEHDGGNNPDQSKPIATPAFYNVTYIGLGADKATYTARSTNTALHLRDNAGGRFYNSAILDFGGAEALIEGATLPGDANAINTSGQRAQTAYVVDGVFNLGPPSTFELEFQDNDFWCIGRQEDLGVPLTLPTGNSVTYGGDPNKNHFDNGFYTNAALDNDYLGCDPNSLPIRALVRTDSGDTATPDQVTTLDPRPKPGSPLLTTNRATPADGFFTPAPYKGAFSATENWAAGWTSLSSLDVIPGCTPPNGLAPNAVPGLTIGKYLNPVVAGGPVARESYLSWDLPAGADLTEDFDLLRATSASGFGSAICIEIDGPDLEAVDAQNPSLGGIYYYLVRAGNGCDEGSLGTTSAGVARVGTTCP